MNIERRALRLKEVMAITGLAKSSIYKQEKEGTFPKRRKLTERATCWFSDEVGAWVGSREVKT